LLTTEVEVIVSLVFILCYYPYRVSILSIIQLMYIVGHLWEGYRPTFAWTKVNSYREQYGPSCRVYGPVLCCQWLLEDFYESG